MKLKFKAQPYQTDAVQAVIDCFAGQPKSKGLGACAMGIHGCKSAFANSYGAGSWKAPMPISTWKESIFQSKRRWRGSSKALWNRINCKAVYRVDFQWRSLI